VGSGMEGAVYALGGGVIGKVWASRQPGELAKLQRFYADLAAARLRVGTPDILDVRSVDGASVTIERELVGTPLQERLSETDAGPRLPEVAGIIEVLRELHSVPACASMRALAVLNEALPFWVDGQGWNESLDVAIMRRVARFGSQLRAAVKDFDAMLSRTRDALRRVKCERLTAIHGDLCGVNILVNADGAPTAVLDFGFLSTAGDPLFDVSVTAAIYNIYGPHAEHIADDLTRQFAKSFGCSEDLLLLYRAVYALLTSNAYDAAGGDGHFAWCAAILNRLSPVRWETKQFWRTDGN